MKDLVMIDLSDAVMYSDSKITLEEAQKFNIFNLRTRLLVLWCALKNVFTNQGLMLSSNVSARFGRDGITASTWVNKGEGWKNLSVSFDGVTEAIGYIDGERVTN